MSVEKHHFWRYFVVKLNWIIVLLSEKQTIELYTN